MHRDHSFNMFERRLLQGSSVNSAELETMQNWYPISIRTNPSRVSWRDMGSTRFTESFFQDTLSNQERDLRRVTETDLARLSHISNFLQPSLFVFHISRCGSTLMTQMLSRLETCIVLSEPPVIDAFFRHFSEPTEKNLQIFRDLIAALGQRRFASERHLVIKLDSWHLPYLAFVQNAFPKVPCIFLYREPQAVLASHQRSRGPQMVPGLIDLTDLLIDETDLEAHDLDGYCLTVLSALYQNAIQLHEKFALQLIHYRQLPGIIWDNLLEQIGIDISEDDLIEMKQRSQFHSKHGHQIFAEEVINRVEHPRLYKAKSLYQCLDQYNSA
ncbi:hypothetical protein [Undibacterium fentianense]|uniref:Sulfotransferase family protein n=1 Tax=Undibacterium fentianense TaxID=2828728 RepID=A0A941ID26_9BURK|nr:hypothetical protein [Undibacterium fentianense]MBR7799503.1 hypothetical protein [Undibacterium fentianense]